MNTDDFRSPPKHRCEEWSPATWYIVRCDICKEMAYIIPRLILEDVHMYTFFQSFYLLNH